MCKFISAIVLRNGDVICDPEHTDSHADLIKSIGLNDYDPNRLDRFCKIEFTPPDDQSKIGEVEEWNLAIDEQLPVSWFEEVSPQVLGAMRALVRGMIVDRAKFLLGGCHVVLSGKVVCKNSRVLAHDSSQVTAYGRSRADIKSVCATLIDERLKK